MTTVLVVDDEPNLIDLVTSYLEREDYVVQRAVDGPSAVEHARTLRPDLVVLEFSRELKAPERHLPSSADASDAQAGPSAIGRCRWLAHFRAPLHGDRLLKSLSSTLSYVRWGLKQG
jgi:CheY-like chemotaxis protein